MARDKETNKKNSPLAKERTSGFRNRDIREPGAILEEPSTDVDEKIRQLEKQLNEMKKLRENVKPDLKQKDAEEEQERAAIRSVNNKYAARKLSENKEKTSGLGRSIGSLDNLSADRLLTANPKDAVASLVAIAKENTNGFEKAIELARRVAIRPGGAWILDQFHLEMTKNKDKTTEKH